MKTPEKTNCTSARKKQLRKPYIRQFYKNNRLLFAGGVLTYILLGSVNLIISALCKELIDTISGVFGALSLKTLLLYTVTTIGLIALFELFNYFTKPQFMKRAMLQYKNFAFQNLSKKSIASFHDEAASTYISALSNDANSIETNYLSLQFNLFYNVFIFVGAFALMLYYSPVLTLAALLLSALPLLASVFAGTRLESAERKVSDRNARFTATLTDSLSGFAVVKSFKAENAIAEQFEKSNRSVEDAKCKSRRISLAIDTIASVAGTTAQLGVFLAGAYLALSGRGITAGTVLAFTNLMNFVIQPIGTLPGIFAGRKASLALIDKLAAALERNLSHTGTNIQKQLKQGIEIRDLSFGYEENTDILHNLNLQIEAGKSYAIVGASGSGKTTLLQLLMAAHDYRGSICFDGTELKSISNDSLYELISMIQQNVFVFNASIRDNITMFREFPKEETERAIALSGLSALIETHGEDYLCGENGCNLSGGEKQRISIARCLLRRSGILLADEATAALDPQTACQVASSILNLSGITRIVVTHSLDESLLKQYDCIIALKNGCISECGNFRELMDRKGYFYSLYTVSQ